MSRLKLPGHFLMLCASIVASMSLAACSAPPAGSLPPSSKSILFEAEATFTGAAAGAGAYVNLPDCAAPNAPKVCKSADIAAKVVTGVDSASVALHTAETLILGCQLLQYVAATDTPPIGTCGQPVADQDAQHQAIIAAQAAISAVQAAIPIIQSAQGI